MKISSLLFVVGITSFIIIIYTMISPATTNIYPLNTPEFRAVPVVSLSLSLLLLFMEK